MRENDTKPNAENTFKIDAKIGDAFQGGMDALQKAFAGFVDMAKKAVSPEVMRNLEAGQWLGQVAACVDEAAAGLRESAKLPSGKAGELACHLERLDVELKSSKFEGQQAELRRRLESVVQGLDRAAETSGLNVIEAKKLAEVAGYFHAASKSVSSLGGVPQTFSFKS